MRRKRREDKGPLTLGLIIKRSRSNQVLRVEKVRKESRERVSARGSLTLSDDDKSRFVVVKAVRK